MKAVDSSISSGWKNEMKKVSVDIYKSKENSKNYYFVLQGKETAALPESVEKKPWKTIEIESGQALVAANTTEIIKDIESKGFSLVSAEIRFELK